MTSVEKRRSSRKSGGHRKHSNGSFSDTSSSGSFLDETDREVCNLTDRAFRSLCIGDDAVYNDSDLCFSSPGAQRDKQLSIYLNAEEREREERKRAAHENFNHRVQEYGQDWILGGIYKTEIHRDPHLEVYGERTEGMVSATFQHSFVETSHLGKSLRDEAPSFFSNGTTELSSQHARSRSRVSSLIKAFNSDGQKDGAAQDDSSRERNDETSWDESALMSIQRELSEFSTSYQQHLPSSGQFSCMEANFYSTEVGAAAQMPHNSAPLYLRSSQTMYTNNMVNCASNFFFHSECSPFKLWRDYNRFPFQQAKVPGFVHCSEFQKWYQTPMYNELSMEHQSQGPYGDIRHRRNNLAPGAPPRPNSSLSAHQKASAVEKRCESELAGHYPQRKQTQSLGTYKLPSQRPSTASPTAEMSRCVRDTISSFRALQEKLKMMTEQNITPMNHQGGLERNEKIRNPVKNPAVMESVATSKTTPSGIKQLVTHSFQTNPEAETPHLTQHEASTQPVEHPPVRAESRGATPDMRVSSYRSRASSLLFNLKDNRKRVKSTYSPPKFKGFEPQDITTQPALQEPHQTITDLAENQKSDSHLQKEETTVRNVPTNQYNSPWSSLTSHAAQAAGEYTDQNPEKSPRVHDVNMLDSMVHHAGLSHHQLSDGQSPIEYSAPFSVYKQSSTNNFGSVEELKACSVRDTARLNADNKQNKGLLISTVNTKQPFNETAGGVFTKVADYEQLREKHYYKDEPSEHEFKQMNKQDRDSLSFKSSNQYTGLTTEMQRQGAQTSKRNNLEGQFNEFFSSGTSYERHPQLDSKNNKKDHHLTQSYSKYPFQDFKTQHGLYHTANNPVDKQITSQYKDSTNIVKGLEKESQYEKEAKPKFEKDFQEHLPSHPDNCGTPTNPNPMNARQNIKVKKEQLTTEEQGAEARKIQHIAKKERAKAQEENLKTEESRSERAKQESFREEIVSHNQEQEIKREQKVQSTEEKPECEIERNRVQKKDEKGREEYTRQEPSTQVKEAKAENEKLKEELMETVTAKIEVAEGDESKQAKLEDTTRNLNINAEQHIKEQPSIQSDGTEHIKIDKVNEDVAGFERRKTEQTNPREKLTADHRKTVTAGEVEGNKDNQNDSSQSSEASVNKSTRNPKAEEIDLVRAKAELLKTDHLLEKSVQLTAKLLASQQVKNEPDKVEQVKTELAKAKAELAKIKEKMRGEQQDKIRKEDDLLRTKKEKREENKTLINSKEIQTQREAEGSEHFREKHSFSDTVSRNTLKESVTGRTPANDAGEFKAEKLEDMTSFDRVCLENQMLTVNSESRGKDSLEHFKEIKSQCFQGESSKEVSLSPTLTTNVCDKPKEENVAENLQKYSRQNSAQNVVLKDSQPTEYVKRKSCTEQNINSNKDLPTSHSKTLLHKDKTHTKHEILTSKIKAHAEKEISAIKEKGFVLREGFIGKSSMRQLSSGHTGNVRQKPHSLEMLKKHNNAASTDISPLDQIDPELHTQAIKFATTSISATIQAESVENTDLLKNDTKANQTTCSVENENHLLKESKTHWNTEDNDRCNQEITGEILKETRGLTNATSDNVGTPPPLPKEEAEIEEEAHKNTKLLNTNADQENVVASESLQIMGIMVTVLEREPPVNIIHESERMEKQIDTTEKQSNTLELETRMTSPENNRNSEKTNSPLMKENETRTDNSPERLQEMSTFDIKNTALSESMMEKSCIFNAEFKQENEPQLVTVLAKDELLTGHKNSVYKENTIVEKAKNITKTPTEEKLAKELVKQSEQKKNVVNKNQQLQENKTSDAENYHSEVNNPESGLEKQQIPHSSDISDQCAGLLDEKMHPPEVPNIFNNTSLSRNSYDKENRDESQNLLSSKTQDDDNSREINDVHIDNIAIRVVPSVTLNDDISILGKGQIKPIAFDNDVELSENKAKMPESITQARSGGERREDQRKERSLEDKLAVQYVLSSVKKLSDSLKANNKQDTTKKTDNTPEAELKTFESNIQSVEADYFEVQGVKEKRNLENNILPAKDSSTEKQPPELSHYKSTDSNKSGQECKKEAFIFTADQTEKTDLPSSGNAHDGNIQKHIFETEHTQSNASTERWGNQEKYNHIRKHHHESRSNTSGRKEQSAENPHPAKTIPASNNPRDKPNAKVSTIPEISALADYARLKVIVSEDQHRRSVEEFPPNKKEGFFPLIQSRHSRRPVFREDPQNSVKTKTLPSMTEMSAKMSKEPKSLVFPITEKEYQRTGMFKLGDNDRPEKTSLKARISSDLLGPEGNARNLSETNTLSTAQSELLNVACVERRRLQPADLQTPTSDAASNVITRSAGEMAGLGKDDLTNATVGNVNHKRENTTYPMQNESPPKQHGKSQEAKVQPIIKETKQIKRQQKEERKETEGKRIQHMIEESRASRAEEERRAIQREEERRAREREAVAIMIKERRDKQKQSEGEGKNVKLSQEEKVCQKGNESQTKSMLGNNLVTETMKVEGIKEEKSLSLRARVQKTESTNLKVNQKLEHNEGKKADEQLEERRDAYGQQRREAMENYQRTKTEEQQEQRQLFLEENQKGAIEGLTMKVKDHFKRGAFEQQREAKEKKNRPIQQEEQMDSAHDEQKAALMEEQGRAVQENQHRRRPSCDEQQMSSAVKEKQRRALQEEERSWTEEHRTRASHHEQQRESHPWKQKMATHEQQQEREEVVLKGWHAQERQRGEGADDQLKKLQQREEHENTVQENQQRASKEEEEHQRRAAQEKMLMKADLIEKRHNRENAIENGTKTRRGDNHDFVLQEERLKNIENIHEHNTCREIKEEQILSLKEEKHGTIEKVTISGSTEQKKTKQAAISMEKSTEQSKGRQYEKVDDGQAHDKDKDGHLPALREKTRSAWSERQKGAEQTMDSLQYYAITSPDGEKSLRERQISTSSYSQLSTHNTKQLELESQTESLYLSGSHRPYPAVSPAPSLPRSNTSSPALGAKPSMFRVKDNTMRGTSFIKSVKPCFHKNFGEDYRAGSPLDRSSDRAEDERELMRQNTGTPIHSSKLLKRADISKSSSSISISSLPGSSNSLNQRPYSRRSLAMDDDESRSVISNMSEDAESFATSAADLTDVHGLFDFDRPESACSFSSDVSRSLGKPPLVPPKSEKALRRAQRLTYRRMKKELSMGTGVEKELSRSPPSSSSNEVSSSNRHVVASPHVSPPIAIVHAPKRGSSLPSSHAEKQSPNHSFHASPHATGPISLPISLPTGSTVPPLSVSNSAPPSTASHVSSSSSLHTPSTPVAQYQVESCSFPHQAYPVTQRKVLQDLGSGQYFVVDMPVQVKTKTFFDPETGKYVQLNVRQTGQNISQAHLQQTYQQPHLQIKQQHQPMSHVPIAGKPFVLYQNYHSHPHNYQQAVTNSAQSSAPSNLPQHEQPLRESHTYRDPAPESEPNFEGHCTEKTPYMDTVKDVNKTFNVVNNAQNSSKSLPESDTNCQRNRSSVCENDPSLNSLCEPRDIISMSELEDFMEVSDW